MGEKKRRLAAGTGSPPRFDRRLIAAALQALDRGDRRGAEAAFEGLRSASSDDPDALHAVGVIALRLDRDDIALELLDRANAIDAGNPAYRCHRAIALRRTGQLERAIADLDVALRIDPRLAEAHSNLGTLLFERGQIGAAAASFGHALELRADQPEASNGLGRCLLDQGRYAEACARFERALALDPSFHEAAFNLSRAHALCAAVAGEASVATASEAAPASSGARPGDRGAPGGPEAAPAAARRHLELALAAILAAIRSSRDNATYWAQFAACISSVGLRHPADPQLLDALAAALEQPAVDPARLAAPIVGLVLTHPDVAAVAERPPADLRTAERTLLERAALAVCGDPLMQKLLGNAVVANAAIEALLGFARGECLRRAADGWSEPTFLPLPALVVVAQHAFNGEYVGDESAEERAALARLVEAIAAIHAAGGAAPLHAYAVYACYRPLGTLDAADALVTRLGPTALGPVVLRQIVEPREERRLLPTIGALTDVVDNTSAAVREQYEDRPYPRWQRARGERSWPSVGAMLRQRYPEARLDGAAGGRDRILVAGCGTGRHPVTTARRFPDSSVLAIDLSRPSLAYALRKTRELGLSNVEYRQADLLALAALDERFDSIECAGVLHHLADPLAGWRTLVSLLRPGGVMLIGLYSEAARRHVVRAREIVAAEGMPPTPDGLRAFRRAVLARMDDPLCARLARSEDFYSLSGVRDLAFHVCEHRFTLPRIAAMLAELGLDFVGFELPDAGTAALYRARFPEDRALCDLGRWHRFEQDRPDTFAQMYQFWVHKPPPAAGCGEQHDRRPDD